MGSFLGSVLSPRGHRWVPGCPDLCQIWHNGGGHPALRFPEGFFFGQVEEELQEQEFLDRCFQEMLEEEDQDWFIPARDLPQQQLSGVPVADGHASEDILVRGSCRGWGGGSGHQNEPLGVLPAGCWWPGFGEHPENPKQPSSASHSGGDGAGAPHPRGVPSWGPFCAFWPQLGSLGCPEGC